VIGGLAQHGCDREAPGFAAVEEIRSVDRNATECKSGVCSIANESRFNIEVAAVTIIGRWNHHEVSKALIFQARTRHWHIRVNIGVHNEEWFATQHRQSLVNSATGLEDIVALLAVDYFEAVPLSGTHMFDDLVTQPAKVDNHRFDTGGPHVVEMTLEQTLPADFDQRLGNRIRKRSQTFTAPGGKDHCLHGLSFIPGKTRSSIRSTRKPSSS